MTFWDWLSKLPGKALALGCIGFGVGVVVLLLSTPACSTIQVRGFSFVSSRGCETTSHPEAKHGDSSKAKASDASDDAAQPGDHAEADGQALSVPDNRTGAKVSPQILIKFAPSDARDLRRDGRLKRVVAEADVLNEMPSGTFGYFFAGSFATVWRADLGSLTIRNAVHDIYFEAQKHADGTLYIVGYVRHDVAESLQQGSTAHLKIELQSQRYRSTDDAVAIPFAAITSIGQSEITFEKGVIPILVVGIS